VALVSMTKNSKPSIQLHYASLKLLNDKGFRAQVYAWLSSVEQERYQRFACAQQADQFLLARALLRCQLSKYIPDVSPAEWVFVIEESGKPRLADNFSHLNIQFNLSHSEGLVVVAFSDGLNLGEGLGVDIENIHRPVFNMALAKRYFAGDELTALMQLDEEQKIERIVQLWTLKESLLKACGLGVRVPLAKIGLFFNGGAYLDLRLSPDLAMPLFSEEGWLISLFTLGPDYCLALTIRAVDCSCIPEVSCHEWAGISDRVLALPCELQRKNYE